MTCVTFPRTDSSVKIFQKIPVIVYDFIIIFLLFFFLVLSMEISLLILISFLITKDMLPSTREAVT